MRHAFGAGSSSTCADFVAMPPDDTALSSPPRPVDFSADVAASVRRYYVVLRPRTHARLYVSSSFLPDAPAM